MAIYTDSNGNKYFKDGFTAGFILKPNICFLPDVKLSDDEMFDGCCFLPDEAIHWNQYNDSQLWDKSRFKAGKYEIVACIDHESVKDAFETLAKYYMMITNMHFDEDYLEFEDEVRIKDAQDVLEKNGFKLEADGYPDEAWREKINKRVHSGCYDPLMIPLKDRPRPVETDDLPF